ncbi:phage antirepressor [Streptococcus dysgalactiae]|uniref:Phage antirepressor n=1 Tax=Streptococcus dysgalactiae subsp. dysgalactiae TaxID=99822 RepID=A0A9X7X9A6_STRDY|nr:phage antirepressor KilAC domain-containing protein [Streptococcus dysgalactiae]QGH03018.1 phage antirepressor [Streptococcus dysgalactiae subsp. dysgalactiae]
MDNLTVFENAEFGSVRTVTIKGIPYFVGKDVASVLGYSNTRDALAKRLDEEDKDGVAICDSIGREQIVTVINESGLYSLILSSKMPNAKKFKRWVTNEVLPSIRQHGVYATDSFIKKSIEDPAWAISVLQELQAKEEKLAMQQQIILEMKPKVSYYDLILQSTSVVSISKISKDYGMSPQALNKLLHELGVQYKQGKMWLLYQKYADQGYTQSKTHTINAEKSVMHTYWTQKGRLFLYELLKTKKSILPMIERGEENV